MCRIRGGQLTQCLHLSQLVLSKIVDCAHTSHNLDPGRAE